MSEDHQTLTLIIEDVVGGQKISPKNVDLPTLRSSLEEFEAFIKGSQKGLELDESRVRVLPGSLKLTVAATALILAGAIQDIQNIRQTKDLTSVDPKRAEIMEKWRLRSERDPGLRYSIGIGRHKLHITSKTQFTRSEDVNWIPVDKYISGKIIDVGGKQRPNIHLDLDSGRSIRVDATEEQLKSLERNLLYKQVTIHVNAKQHLRTNELDNYSLIEFIYDEERINEDALKRLWEKGKKAWGEIDSVGNWIQEIRGGYAP